MGIFAAKVTAQDQNTFVVCSPAQFGFPFDIGDPAATHEGLCRDPRGLAKTKISHLIDRQAVHLSNRCSGDIHQQRPLGDQLLNSFLDQVQAKGLFFDRPGHVFAGDQFASVLLGPIVGFDDEINDIAKAS